MKTSVIHGWKEGDVYYTSLRPEAENGPKNAHVNSTDALREASRRKLPIVWDDPEAID